MTMIEETKVSENQSDPEDLDVPESIDGAATALLWVIVLASVMAMGIQVNAVKLGIATGKAVLCRERLPRTAELVLWLAAELAMIATDMAEIIGAAVGFQLVCNFPP
uniref:Uncharacterized protein n=1 Tax=Amphora coffeiformis TaxID=265554 RepID=A0A7S3LCN8_9STRA